MINTNENFRALTISSVRDILGITRKELADAINLTRDQEKLLKDWESGKLAVPDDVFHAITSFPLKPPFVAPAKDSCKFTQIDLFAGVGGIRLGFQNNGGRTVFSSEIDKFAQKTYRINYGECPSGDITKIDPKEIPDHDFLLGGFPCQPFSQAGKGLGFEDARGTLFFTIAEIIKEKRPKAFMLENVKRLRTHDGGKTLKTILAILDELGYYVPTPQVLNAYHFGVPQNRQRIFIVGFDKSLLPDDFNEYVFPTGHIDPATCVKDILQDEVPEKFTISDKLYQFHLNRREKHKAKGNGFGFSLFDENSPYTNTIVARYYRDGQEALISQDGKNPRMLTPRECARLQGFPDNFIIPVSNTQAYKQFGNSVCVNVIDAIAKSMVEYLENYNLL